ncbi:uncharacterized protein YdiU (UPF0061 family) [Gracilibacillus halotolerans]|uniref:Protein nucleotidyltransferase YdiU n=1 Tax=Gracilibacillus halotolerans TaxID=74386 RepID=A0A841RNH4_9BACI|nr:YdiU family protein [Gracilibacillus halotolerans]MBB6513432.1 uncharacterized protein YdiU (UPF0061 family) [Gracilibacillus halotolerans]
MTNNTTNNGWNLESSYTSLPEKFYDKMKPEPVSDPTLVLFNISLAEDLGLQEEVSENPEIFAGNELPTGSEPLAQAYAGHQFGHFTMLGDGRAILLGEQVTHEGERYDIQLKGAGKTAYSRGGDGRAALGPMLREFIISEAMYALGVPTTRSLAVATTGELIQREIELPGAILTRVAKSHIRVGTFQYAAKWGENGDLKKLADYTIERHFPSIKEANTPYEQLLKEVIRNQASLIAKWQLIGFIHGVMNTDNVTISGETIDYGPCAFMDEYDPNTVFSSIDRNRRYAYGNQPNIGVWNIARFAETLLPLLDQDQDKAVKIAEEAIGQFGDIFQEVWLEGMRGKLGLFQSEEQDKELVHELLELMHQYKADYTNTFRALTFDDMNSMVLFGTDEFKNWKQKWVTRKKKENKSSQEVLDLMKSSNPAVIPRNHHVEDALHAAVEHTDMSEVEKLLHALTDPYAHTEEQKEYASLPPKDLRPQQTFCGT